MIERVNNSHEGRRTSIWSVACGRFLSLGSDENGAALVTTLAMFMFIFLVCTGVFTVSTAVRERIHLQNAADAAAYSAAVVQADTLSRIATINRAMAWTYVQMTRRQMDYIVLRWLQHTVKHYDTDSAAANAYNKGGILGPPCGGHGSEGTETWFIGANTSGSSMNHVQLNGWNLSNYLGVDLEIPGISEISGLVGIGSTPHIDTVKGALTSYALMTAFTQLKEGVTGDGVIANGIGGLSALKEIVFGVSSSEPPSNWETYLSIKAMFDGYSGTVPGKYEGAGTAVEQLLQVQIALDRLNIAMMNICERRLAVEMPQKIATTVQNIVRANVPEYMADDCFYYLEQNGNPVIDEDIPDRLGTLTSGYFGNLYNNPTDEKRFLSFADYNRSLIDEFKLGSGSENLSPLEEVNRVLLSRVAAGLDQWFVRGNGNKRTDDSRGLQRCYKHWAEGPFADIHATHNPFPPSCWNTDKDYLNNSPASIALYSEWVWWSDVWSCPKFLWFQLHIHPCPHASKIWPWKMECDHNSEPGMFGLGDLAEATKAIADLPGAADDIGNLINGVFKGRGSEGDETYVAPTEDNLTDDERKALEDLDLDSIGDSYAGLKDHVNGNDFDTSKVEPTDIDSYEDGCLMVPFLGTGDAAGHVAGYARLYADAPQLYNSCYVGERAKPLILRANYFGKAGTLTVGIARRNSNVWERILGMVEGVFSAFDPDVAWTWAFASAKAGHMDKGESPADRNYRVDWDSAEQGWNLCQSDWDAVFIPVRHAHSVAWAGTWLGTGSGYSSWLEDVDGWMPVGKSDAAIDDAWTDVQAPRGMLTVGGTRGKLDWGALGDVTYH